MQNNNAVCLPHLPPCVSVDAKLAEQTGDLPIQVAKRSQISSKTSSEDISSRSASQTVYQKVELKLDGQQQTFFMPMAGVRPSAPQPITSRTLPLAPPKALQAVQGAPKMSSPEPMTPVVIVPEKTLLTSNINTNSNIAEELSLSTKGPVSSKPLLSSNGSCPVESDGNRILQPLKKKRGRPKRSFSPVKKSKIMNEKRRCRVLKPNSDQNSDDSCIGANELDGDNGIQISTPLQQTGRLYSQMTSKQLDKVTHVAVPLDSADTIESGCNENLTNNTVRVTTEPVDQEEPFLKIHSVYSLSTRPNECAFNDSAKIPNEGSNAVSERDQETCTLSCATEVKKNNTVDEDCQNPLSEVEVPKDKMSRSLFSALSDLTDLDTNDTSRHEDDCSVKSAETMALNIKSEVRGSSHVGNSGLRGKVSDGGGSDTAKLTMNKSDVASANEQKNLGALESVAKGENSPLAHNSVSDLEKHEIDKTVSNLPAKVKSLNPDIIACTAGLKNILKGVSLDCIQQVPNENCPLLVNTETEPVVTNSKVVPTHTVLKNEEEELALKSRKVKGRTLADIVKSLSGGTSFRDSSPPGHRDMCGEKQSDSKLDRDSNDGLKGEQSSELNRQLPIVQAVDNPLTKSDVVSEPKPIKVPALTEPAKEDDKKIDSVVTDSDQKQRVEVAPYFKIDSKLTSQKTLDDRMNEVFDAVLSADTCFELGDLDSPTKHSAYEALSDPDDLACDHEVVKVNSVAGGKCEHDSTGISDVRKNLELEPLPVVEHVVVPAEEKPAQLEEENVSLPEDVSALYDATTEELEWRTDSSDTSIAPEDFQILKHAFSSYVALDDISVALHGAKVINIGELPLGVNLQFRRPITLDGLKLSNEDPARNHADNAMKKQDIREWIKTTKAADNPGTFESTSSSPLPPELEIEPVTTDNHFFKGISETPPVIDLVSNKNDSNPVVKQSARKTFSNKKRWVSRSAEYSHSDDEFFELNKGKSKDLSELDKKRINRIRVRKWRQAKLTDAELAVEKDAFRNKRSKTESAKDRSNCGDEKHPQIKRKKTVISKVEVSKPVFPSNNMRAKGRGKRQVLNLTMRAKGRGKRQVLNLTKEEKRKRNMMKMREYRLEQKLKKTEGVPKVKTPSQEHVGLLPGKQKQTVKNTELKAVVTHQTLGEKSRKTERDEFTNIHKLTDEDKRLRNAFRAKEWRRKRKLLLMQGKADPGIKRPEKRKKLMSEEKVPLGSKMERSTLEKTIQEVISFKAEEIYESSNAVEVKTGVDLPCVVNGKCDGSAPETTVAENNKGSPSSTKGMKRSLKKTRHASGMRAFSQKGQSNVRNRKPFSKRRTTTDNNNQNRILKPMSKAADSAAEGDGFSSDVFSFKSDSSVEGESTNATKLVHKVKTKSPSLVTAVHNGTVDSGAVQKKRKKRKWKLVTSIASLRKKARYMRERRDRLKKTNSSNGDSVASEGVCSKCPSSEPRVQPIEQVQIKRGRGRPRKDSLDSTHSATLHSVMASPAMSTPIPPASRTKSKLKAANELSTTEPTKLTPANAVTNAFENTVELSPISNTSIAKGKEEHLNKIGLAPFDMNSNIVSNTGDTSQNMNISQTTEKIQVKRGRGRPRKISLVQCGRGRPRKNSLVCVPFNSRKLNVSSVTETTSKDSVKLVSDATVEIPPSGISGTEHPRTSSRVAFASPCPQEPQPVVEKRKRGRLLGSSKKQRVTKSSDSPDITDKPSQLAQVNEAKPRDDIVDENPLWGKEDLTVDTSFEEEPVQNYEMSMNESDDFYLSMSVTSPPMSPVQKRISAPAQPKTRQKRKASNDSEKKTEVPKVHVHVPAQPVLTPEDHAYKLKVLMNKLKSQNEELDKLRAQQK